MDKRWIYFHFSEIFNIGEFGKIDLTILRVRKNISQLGLYKIHDDEASKIC